MNAANSFDRIDNILIPTCSDEALESAGGMAVVAAMTILTPTAK
ncbi:hypothetical protein MSIMFB_00803 [Mycobacterium simulans]|uniref:Uncharacterized protein n=1 Tax=Mycobacterium simulans TaxID=627089 RepID=A0A7Z7N848_9MYCO|nr:hypothetical protein [Mycobacterium simulans]SOJ53303.1 hypothetical protein MSIMFB_00803 [Mycobacterium simulans]SON63883.1 hypothetical protein MSIMFI_05414 [Mycobacterium simulans]